MHFENIIYLPGEPKGRHSNCRTLQKKGVGANGYI
uniref:Uncharacterized protein n=1 Tax=Myoviridae sp. ctNQr16 TaxID=2826644 RepID=A0A8S5MAU2_9CAUD|nr:MAG TPA: hypothetical protein [Myoviridae sp. ctNQr16]